jgi:membrane protein YdbS with pleckstrin-like domain
MSGTESTATPRAIAEGDPFDAEGVFWRGVSPRLASARRAVLASMCGLIGVGVLVVSWLSGIGRLAWVTLVPLLVLGWGWWLIGRQVRAWAYAERPDELLVRAGVMWRRIVVVPYGRLQYVDVDAGPLARAFGLASVQLHTASAGTDSQIPGVATAEAARLRDRLTERGQAQLAGL